MEAIDCPKCGSPTAWKYLEKTVCPVCSPDKLPTPKVIPEHGKSDVWRSMDTAPHDREILIKDIYGAIFKGYWNPAEGEWNGDCGHPLVNVLEPDTWTEIPSSERPQTSPAGREEDRPPVDATVTQGPVLPNRARYRAVMRELTGMFACAGVPEPVEGYEQLPEALPSAVKEMSAQTEDAARYRWLRDEDNWGCDNPQGEKSESLWGDLGELHGQSFDDFIDGLRLKTEG
ncbi:hypothetical protein [Alloalcanivorax xenomutans]|uniref:hypothetical protein n=1 Tax=Alloalcanivorax xenomutans TaxID=1094342 RepID=UPI001F1C8D06|nr:hypothetical protein [Alloalcanivorax xenomutans]MCE7521938.1 hypothetical protein [Alloalcanivorax xenomutans]